jgi:hypothetical protein
VYYREQAIEKITKEKEMAIASKRQTNRPRTILVMLRAKLKCRVVILNGGEAAAKDPTSAEDSDAVDGNAPRVGSVLSPPLARLSPAQDDIGEL